MSRIAFCIALSGALLCLPAGDLTAANHVRIDRLSNVAPGTTGLQVGIYVSNDVPIQGLVLPLEIREYTPGAYMASGGFTRGLNPAGRMSNSPLGPAYDNGNDSIWPAGNATLRTLPALEADTGSGNCVRSFFLNNGSVKWKTSQAQPDFVSPDALLFAYVTTGDPNAGELILMAAGSDPDGVPSLRITMNIGNTQGMFVIDTTCVTPANHISFVNENTQLVVPTFEHGIVGINTIADVKEIETGVVPDEYHLDQNYPNPFNAGTIIRFTNKSDGPVTMDVFNILGARVRTLIDEHLPAGIHQVDWDGTDENGDQVATGVYFYRITTGPFQSTRKMVLLK